MALGDFYLAPNNAVYVEAYNSTYICLYPGLHSDTGAGYTLGMIPDYWEKIDTIPEFPEVATNANVGDFLVDSIGSLWCKTHGDSITLLIPGDNPSMQNHGVGYRVSVRYADSNLEDLQPVYIEYIYAPKESN